MSKFTKVRPKDQYNRNSSKKNREEAQAFAFEGKSPLNAAMAAEKLRRMRYLSLYSLWQMIRRYWHRFIAFGLIVSMALGLINFYQEQLNATTILSLNYESGAKGRNPNGTRFNVSELRSRALIEKVISRVGLTDQIDAQTLAAAIRISPTVQRGINSDSSYYISTSYQISLSLPSEYRQLITADNLLNILCNTYRSDFYQTHMITARALPETFESFDDMEYSSIGEYIKLIATQAQNYLQMRIDNGGSFTSETKDTFKSLLQLVTNLTTYDLAVYNAYIWENGVAKDRDTQISMLSLQNHLLDYSYQQYSLQSTMYQQIVDEYESNMTDSVLIPTYDSNHEYYMARTKTGVDDLSKSAYDTLAKASECKKNIDLNSDKITKLGLMPTRVEYANADQMVEKLREKLADIIARIKTFDSDYIYASTRNYISFTDTAKSLTSYLHPKRMLALSAAACLFLYWVLVLAERRRLKKIIKQIGRPESAKNGG